MWFLNDPTRLQRERSAIKALIEEVNWLPDAVWELWSPGAMRLSLVADIVAHGHLYPVRMVYPSSFPASPPAVMPREERQYWSIHQYGHGGELCLEWGPDNWREEVTGADVLRSAHKLLQSENPLGEKSELHLRVPSRHALHVGQELRSTFLRFLTDNAFMTYVRSVSKQSYGTVHCHLMSSRESFTVFPYRMEPVDDEAWDNPVLPNGLKKAAWSQKTPFLRTSIQSDILKTAVREDLISLLEDEGHDTSQVSDPATLLVLLIDATGGPHLFWSSSGQKWTCFKKIDIYSPDTNARVNPEFSVLSNKDVGLVGLGSVGSKIAISLARSGVCKFLLVDHDILMPENICRHELAWDDVGQHKVDGIVHRLELIARNPNVKCRRLMLSGQEATVSVDSALSQLGECDLIIDATADPSTFNQLSAVASQFQKPLVWMEVFEGGIGGFVARFRPGYDPDPKLMRAYLLESLKDQDIPALKVASAYTGMGSNGEVIVASDADVSVISAHAARMAEDVLAEREPSIFPYSMYLIGLSRGWVFKEPFHTIPIDLSDLPSLPSRPVPLPEDAKEAVSFLVQLIEKKKDENSPTSTGAE